MTNRTAIVGGCYVLLDPFCNSSNFIFKLYDNEAMKRCFFFPFRILRKIGILKDIPLSLKMHTGNWKKQVTKFDNWIVIFGKIDYSGFVKYIKKRNPNATFFFYSWDNQYSFDTNDNTSNLGKIGTFDSKIANATGIHFWGQFYNTKHIDFRNNNPNHVDLYPNNKKDYLFLGQNKNRKKTLLSLETELNKEGYYGVIDIAHKSKMTYPDYFNQIKRFHSIIDIVTEGQTGLTWRVMESIFCDKKLITNNMCITQYDFYNPNNIYLVGNDTRSFKEFFETPYEIVPNEIKNHYTIETWMNNIVNS